MMRAIDMFKTRAIVATLVLGVPGIASGQMANASTAATGLSGAYTARATGYNAVAWNPANLAMPGNPGFSFTMMALDGGSGLTPIDLNRIAPYSGKFIPHSVREQWMLDVAADSGQKGSAIGGLTELGLSVGSLAFQVNTKLATDANLAPDVVEAMLFGNVGRDSTRHTLAFAGSTMQAAAYTTGAVSYGLPLGLIPLPNFSLGATVKYTVGHGVMMAQDNGSTIALNDTVNFPAVMTFPDSAKKGAAGKGVGLDLGAAWTIPGFRFGVSVQNVLNTFKWDTTKMESRSAVGIFSSSTTNFSSDSAAFSAAPAALRTRVAALRFKPVIAAGVAFDWIPMMTVSADARQQMGDGIEVGPKSLVAVGAEYHIIPFVPLRAGVSVMSGGFGVSGGFGIRVAGFETGIAGYVRKRNGGTQPGVTVNLVSIRP